MHPFLRHAVTVIFTLVAFGSAFACPPPQHPPGWIEPTLKEELDAAYLKAQTVVLVEVVRVERTGVWQANGPGTAGATEKAFVRPIKAYKGDIKSFPKYFEYRFSGTTCDRNPGLNNRTKPIVFVAVDGALSMTVPEHIHGPGRYAEALLQLEDLRLASKP